MWQLQGARRKDDVLSKKRRKKKQQHHFVPQWYLQQFTAPDTGFLHVYDFKTGLYGSRKPKNVCAINNYYKQEWTQAGADPFALEDFFAKVVEPHGKSAIQRLLTIPSDFRPEETLAVLAYVEAQRLRVPRQAKLMKQVLEGQLHRIHGPAFAEAYWRGEIELTEAARFEIMRLSLGKAMRWFGRMGWSIICAPPEVHFVTSDNPVIFFNPERPPPTEAGLGYAGTKVLFPLSHERMLMMYHPEYRGGVNALEVLPYPAQEDGEINVHFWPDPIDAEGARIWSWLTAQMCDRLVIGRTEEELRRAIKE